MTLRHAALSSLFVLLTAGCSSSMSEGGSSRGGAGGSGQSGGNGGSSTGGSNTGGSGGSSTGGSGTGGSTGGSGGSGTGGTTGTGGTGGTGGSSGSTGSGGSTGTGGASGTGGSAGAGTGGAGTGGAGAGGTGTGGSAGTGGGAGTAGTGGVVDAGGKGGTAGAAGTSGGAGKDAGSGGGTVDAAPPPPTDGGPPDIPTPMGPCPDFVQGDVNFTTKTGARKAAVTLSSVASTISGPLIVYWHATGSNPTEATRTGGGLPASTVTAAGGVIVAPYDPNTGDQFPWISHYADHDAFFDEILGCAAQKTKINTARVHAAGFSAGGLMTTHLSYARSKYLASVATYSGGASGTFQEPNNKFAAMIMTGGPNDIVVTNFYTASQGWQTTLKNRGNFAMFCDHGGGHSIPTRLVPGVFQFFLDHPYGTNPSPYAGGKIPSGINPPCIE